MGIPDSFNPLMGMDHFKDKGTPSAPATPGDNATTLAEQHDPTANLGTTYVTKHDETSVSGVFEGEQRQPADVDRFSGGSV